MTMPSSDYGRKSASGLRLPEYDAAFDLEQARPIDDLSHWIRQVIRANGMLTGRDGVTGHSNVVAPTGKTVGSIGFRMGTAPLYDAGVVSHFTEIFTVPKSVPGGLRSLVRVHETPAEERIHLYNVTILDTLIYHDVDSNQHTATTLLRPMLIDILKELDYGTPKSRYADVVLLHQPQPSLRLARA